MQTYITSKVEKFQSMLKENTIHDIARNRLTVTSKFFYQSPPLHSSPDSTKEASINLQMDIKLLNPFLQIHI